jgi:hypothetical protein
MNGKGHLIRAHETFEDLLKKNQIPLLQKLAVCINPSQSYLRRDFFMQQVCLALFYSKNSNNT